MRRALVMGVLSLVVACAGPHAAVPTLSPDLGNTRPPPTVEVTASLPPTATRRPPTSTVPPSPTITVATAEPVFSGDLLVIQVGDYYFEPAYITITVGTTVSWHPVGDLFHTVVPKDPPNAWRGGGTTGRGSRDFVWTFDRPGTIYYHCDYHPGAMDAILVVVDDL